MKKSLIKVFFVFTLMILLLPKSFSQSIWNPGATSGTIKTSVDNPTGYPWGVSINNNYTGLWAREFSFTYNSTGKLFSFGASGNSGTLSYGYIGGNSTGGTADASPWMIFKPNGQIGIGTQPVLAKLHVTNLNSSVQLRIERTGSGVGISDIGTDNEGLKFWPGGWNNNSPSLILKPGGKVGIGTTLSSIPSTDPFKLYVTGGIRTEQVKVDIASSNAWADYVFEKNYNLRPLSEVESFVKENKHLPEIPSAKEVEANGINLGEMDALLLKKIEELTLYVIEQAKQIEELKKEKLKSENKFN